MSGGSYNYLCWADASDIGAKLGEVEAMAARLEGINPDGHAAADTREVLAIVGALEFAIRRLSDVWRAVEWRDSCDWSEDQMREQLADYEARRDADEAAGVPVVDGIDEPCPVCGCSNHSCAADCDCCPEHMKEPGGTGTVGG